MPNPTTTDDLEARWRALSDQESVNARAYLDDAWSLLLSRRPRLEADIAADLVSEGNVVRVVCAMVLRLMKNPDGKVEESIDDYRYRRDGLVSSGAMTVTDDELATVTPFARRTRSSVRLVVYGDV